MNLTSLMLVAKHTLTLLSCLSVKLIKHVLLDKNSIVDSSLLRVLKAKLHLGPGVGMQLFFEHRHLAI